MEKTGFKFGIAMFNSLGRFLLLSPAINLTAGEIRNYSLLFHQDHAKDFHILSGDNAVEINAAGISAGIPLQ